MLLGEKVTATEAAQIGMIYKVFPDETFEEDSMKIAATLALMPTRGLALIKSALNKCFSQTLEQQLATEDTLQQQAAHTNDFKEGVRAFLEKRQTKFAGN
jgi:2-(1,2-epoxy-1,2-dihydrophenyl)acetyl-CoA isomerase